MFRSALLLICISCSSLLAQDGWIAEYSLNGNPLALASVHNGADGSVTVLSHVAGDDGAYLLELAEDGVPISTVSVGIGPQTRLAGYSVLADGSAIILCAVLDTLAGMQYSCMGRLENGELLWLKKFDVDFTQAMLLEAPSNSVYVIHAHYEKGYSISRIEQSGTVLFHRQYLHDDYGEVIGYVSPADGGVVLLFLPLDDYEVQPLARFDSAGNVIWYRAILSGSNNLAHQIASDSDGNIILLWSATGQTGRGVPWQSVYMSGMPQSGDSIQWIRTGNTERTFRPIGSSGGSRNIMYTSYVYTGRDTSTVVTAGYNVKLNTTWSRRFTFPVSLQLQSSSMASANDGVIVEVDNRYLVRYFNDSVPEEPCIVEDVNLQFSEPQVLPLPPLIDTEYEVADTMFQLIDIEYSTTGVSSGTLFVCADISSVHTRESYNHSVLLVTPNPVRKGETVWIEVPGLFTDATVTLVEASGQETARMTHPEVHPAGLNSTFVAVETSQLAAGVYSVRVEHAEGVVLAKFVVR